MPPILTRSAKRKLDEEKSGPSSKAGKRTMPDRFSVISWNMQGSGGGDVKASTLRAYMKRVGVSVICLQECGKLFDWTDDDLEAGWRIAIHKQWDAGGGNPRCSLAILVRGIVPVSTHVVSATWTGGRPMIGAYLSHCAVWCVHAPHSSTAYVTTARNSAKFGSATRPWICAGDFNLAPGTVGAPTGGHVASCGLATHQNGRELDWAFVSGFSSYEATRLGTIVSDHYAVAFTLEL